MKLPRRLDNILKKKEEFLDQARTKLENTALRLQVDLFEKIISEIIPQLDVQDGKILETANNYRLISQMDKVYDTFNVKVINTILPLINKGIDEISNLASDYFTMSFPELPKKFEQIIESTRVITELRIGLREGKMVRGGTFMSMLNVDPADMQKLMSKAVSSQMNMKDFIKIIKENINGSEEKIGSLERQFNRFTYDTYQQYDAAYNKKLAEEFDFKYFIYQGGLVKDSRDFCVCHNGKVFSKEEAETWKEWKPDDCDYPAGYEIKAKDPSIHPSYMDYPEYDPLIDRGGYNCRHVLGYMPDELAFKYRPELAKK